jgi:hypothetical protein
LTATTGARLRLKMRMARRVPSDSTTFAAFSPSRTVRAFAFSAPAYVALAWTGKRPCVSPVSDPTSSGGSPPITRARMSTDSTYQSAWL